MKILAPEGLISGCAERPWGLAAASISQDRHGHGDEPGDDFTGPTAPVALAVTGGTGAYEGARGSGINKKRSARGRLSDTTIHLLP